MRRVYDSSPGRAAHFNRVLMLAVQLSVAHSTYGIFMTTEPPIYSTLQPCPFCGCATVATAYSGQPAQCGFMECTACKAQGPESASTSAAGGSLDFGEIVGLWNTRTNPSPDREGLIDKIR